jgi:hypothetical protein
MTAARSRAAELGADCPGWRPSPGEAGRRLDAQEPAVAGAGVMAGLGGKRGDGRNVAGTFGLDHQLGALAVQDLADGAVERPWSIITSQSLICSTSPSRWLETNTVTPWSARPRSRLRISVIPGPVGRLIKHQQRRIWQQRSDDAESLPHAQREPGLRWKRSDVTPGWRAQGRLGLKAGDFLGVDRESRTRRQV